MTIDDFLSELQTYFEFSLGERRLIQWSQRLQKYDDNERTQLFDWLLNNCKTRPRIAHLKEGASLIGIAERHALASAKISPWALDQKSSCLRCGGTGLLRVIKEISRDEEGKIRKRIEKVRPLPDQLKPEPWKYSYLYRCDCAASMRQPESVPRLQREE